MNNQKLQKVFKNPPVSSQLILVLIILVILTIGGVLIYRYWWIPKEILSIKPLEVKEGKPSEIITPEISPEELEVMPEKFLELEIGE